MDAMHAFVFGFSLAIAIGPIALLIVHNGVNHGLRMAVLAALGAARDRKSTRLNSSHR